MGIGKLEDIPKIDRSNVKSSISIMSISLLLMFSISLTFLIDTEYAFALEVSLPQNAVSEINFDSIAIGDVASNENGVYILYWDIGGQTSLKFVSSFDNGQTWNTPVLLETGVTNTDVPVTDRIFINDSGIIGVSWEDEHDPINLKFAISNDNGLSFIQLADFESEDGLIAEQIAWAADNNLVAVTYTDVLSGDNQVVSVSTDFGSSWSEPVSVFNGLEIDNPTDGQVYVDGSVIYATWVGVDDDVTKNVYFSKSNDNGLTWNTPIVLSASTSGGPSPKLITQPETDNLLVIWQNDLGHTFQRTSSDAGNTFGAIHQIDDRTYCDISYDIDNLDSNVIFTCDGINQSPLNTGRFVKLSTDFGETYSPFVPITGTDQVPVFRTFYEPLVKIMN